MLKTLASLTRTASAEREAAALQRATDAELAANAIARHCGQLHDALQEALDALSTTDTYGTYEPTRARGHAVLDQADRWSKR